MKPRLVDHYTYDDILKAYLSCRRRKRSTLPCFRYEVNFEHNLLSLLDEINSGSYVISPSRVFVVTWPKAREVWAAQFRDRIVHHLVYNDIAPFYISRFINTNCACIKDRGTLYAVDWLERYCRSVTEDWHKPAWVLQFDIRNFFVSVNKDILWDVLKRDLGETSLTARLLRQIIFHDPTENAIVKRGTNFNVVPYHKSLWHAPKNHGMPIGDLPSQLCCSGIYLDGLDQFCKHVLKIRYYVRYVDDGVALFRDKDEARHAATEIDRWLRENRELHLAPQKTIIKPTDSGINFAGSIVLPHRRYTRNMTVGRARLAMEALRSNPLDRKAFDSLNSYLGLLRTSDSFNLRRMLCHNVILPGILACDSEYTKLFYLINVA